MLPVLIPGAGDQAPQRFLEFFTINIRNRNARAAYARAAAKFLFRAAIGKTTKVGQRRCRGRMSGTWCRCASDAGIETGIGCHTFRATGITDYPTNSGRIAVAQRMATRTRKPRTSTTGATMI